MNVRLRLVVDSKLEWLLNIETVADLSRVRVAPLVFIVCEWMRVSEQAETKAGILRG